MPRFTEQEKEIISSKLLIEGEKLFALHGLKKVTVDDLVAAVNISKGSFYAFYPSKEHLYVDINFRLQKELFESIEATIKEKKYKTHRDLAKDAIMLSLTGLITSPILSQIDLPYWTICKENYHRIFLKAICTMIFVYWRYWKI